MLARNNRKLNSNIHIVVEDFCITLHRSELQFSDEENSKRFSTYVDLICQFGKMYMPELLKE